MFPLAVKRSLIFLFVTLALFATLSCFLMFDPVLASLADREITQNQGESMRSWWHEDSTVENVTAIFAGIAAILWLWAIGRAKTQGIFLRWQDQICTVLLMLAMVVLAGEEISWGQRIFGIETPEYLMETNIQKELNLHNIDTRIPIQYFLYFGALAWGVILPILQVSSQFIHKLAWTFRCPVPPLYLASLFIGAPLFRIAYFSSHGNPAREGMELLFSVAFLAVALHAAMKPSGVWVQAGTPVEDVNPLQAQAGWFRQS